MLTCAKSVRYIKHWLRYGHLKKYISIGNQCIFVPGSKLYEPEQEHRDFLLKCISLDGHISANIYYFQLIFNIFCIIFHALLENGVQWWKTSLKIHLCDATTLVLYLQSYRTGIHILLFIRNFFIRNYI